MVKKESTEWKAQVERAERKARIARMKGSQGEKKKIGSHSIWKKVTIITVCVVLVVALLGWLIFGTGMIVRHVTALTVDGRKFSASDVNLSIGNTVANAQLGLAFTDEFQKTLMSPSPFAPGQTMRDLLIESSVSQLKYVAAAVHEMEKSEFKLGDEEKEQIKSSLEMYDKQLLEFSNQSGRSVTAILRMYYGPGITMKAVKRNMEENMKLNYYVDYVRGQADVSDAKIASYYGEHKDELDLFTYYFYEFKPSDPSLKDDALKKALDELESKANAANEALSGSTFLEAVCKQLSEDDAKKLREKESSLLHQRQKKSGVTGGVFDFLKDGERKKDDAKVIRGTSSVTLVQFVSREKNEFKPYSVRHILIAGEKKKDGDKNLPDDAALKKEAEEVLAAFNAGEKTEEAFAELAKGKSKDPGSASRGGLYADITSDKHAQFVQPFREWCEDSSRKAGDTGIVKTDFGYHIMYFVSRAEENELLTTIRETLRNEHVRNWSQTVSKDVEVVRHSFGMKFVASNNPLKTFFSKGEGEKPAPSETVSGTTTVPAGSETSAPSTKETSSVTTAPAGTEETSAPSTKETTSSGTTATASGTGEATSRPEGSTTATGEDRTEATATE